MKAWVAAGPGRRRGGEAEVDWRDEGVLIAVRRHGESAAIVEVFTARTAGTPAWCAAAASRRWTPILQPGARLSVEWSARLEAHIGHFRVDPIETPLAAVLADRAALAALGSVTALIAAALPERAAHPALYAATRDLVAALGRAPDWRARYAPLGARAAGRARLRARSVALRRQRGDRGPRLCLAEVGARGQPRRRRRLGRAAAAAAGLPARGRSRPGGPRWAQALALTGHFLETRLAPTLPRARCRRRGRGR